MHKIGTKVSLAVAAVSASMLINTTPAPAADMLTSPVEILVGATPGGGYDRMARALQNIFEQKKLISQPINITYHPGGGGAVAWAKVSRTPGDMTKLSIISPNIITNDVLGTSPQTYKDFTIISTLVVEDGCFAVNPKGAINSAETLVKALKEHPDQLKFGFGVAAGNQWHVTMARLAEEVGSDITKVRATVLDSGGKANAALLGQHTDVSVSGCASFSKQHEAGDLKIIAIAGTERLKGALANVPTWKELGYNVVWGAWRGVLGPKGMTDDQVAYWEGKFKAAVSADEWTALADENYWRTSFMGRKESEKLLETERAQYQKTLKALGLIN